MNDFTDLNRGDLVRLKDDYSWGGGKFAGKTVEIVSGDDYREHEKDLVIYSADLRARGSVVYGGLSVKAEDIAEKAEGWCSSTDCAEPVFNENEPCGYHRQQAATWNNFLSGVMA